MEFELYGETYILVDYKIDRNEMFLSKLVMIKNIDSDNTVTFVIHGSENELDNLNIRSADTVVSKVFNNLTSNEKFFYNNILKNDVMLSCTINKNANITVLGNRKFNEVKDLEGFLNQLAEYQRNYTCVEYDEKSNSLLKAKFIK